MTAPRGAVGERHEELLGGAVDYVLAHAVGGLSLRPLAGALGTRDRMLVYYCGRRDALVAAVLGRAPRRLEGLLADALPSGPSAPAVVLRGALGALERPGAEPLLRLWLEVAGLAVQGDPNCLRTSRRVLDGWLRFLAERLDLPAAERRPAASALLAIMDGLVLQQLVGGGADAARGAEWLGSEGLPSRRPAG